MQVSYRTAPIDIALTRFLCRLVFLSVANERMYKCGDGSGKSERVQFGMFRRIVHLCKNKSTSSRNLRRSRAANGVVDRPNRNCRPLHSSSSRQQTLLSMTPERLPSDSRATGSSRAMMKAGRLKTARPTNISPRNRVESIPIHRPQRLVAAIRSHGQSLDRHEIRNPSRGHFVIGPSASSPNF
jgi:hypothetical protein